MRIGQVARLVAERRDGTWTTGRITIVSEVVGPIDRIEGARLEVLGQQRAAPGARGTTLRAGDRVAVSGLRRPDQTIVASLIEKRAAGPDQIAVAVTEDDGRQYPDRRPDDRPASAPRWLASASSRVASWRRRIRRS